MRSQLYLTILHRDLISNLTEKVMHEYSYIQKQSSRGHPANPAHVHKGALPPILCILPEHPITITRTDLQGSLCVFLFQTDYSNNSTKPKLCT